MAETADPIASLLERHRERLLVCVGRRLAPGLRARCSAEDIVQEAWCEARRDHARTGQLPEPGAEFVWIYRKALDCLSAAWRHATAKRRDVRQDDDLIDCSSFGPVPADTATGPVTAARRAELNRAVHEILGGLKPEYREVMLLHGLDQLSLGETATLLGITETNAGVRYWRAVRAFKALWAEHHPDGSFG
jgi:RNA polymerase sigma factor (sigma-70 family)